MDIQKELKEIQETIDVTHIAWERLGDVIDSLTTKGCNGCVHAKARHCMLGANHCTRGAVDMYRKEEDDNGNT